MIQFFCKGEVLEIMQKNLAETPTIGVFAKFSQIPIWEFWN